MLKKLFLISAAAVLLLGGVAQAARDVAGPLDTVQGVPNDGDWPPNEVPRQACDDQILTKYLHFKGGTTATGIRVTPVVGPTVVAGLTFTSANDAAGRDPVEYQLSGSNESIDGPYTLIAEGPITDFAGSAEWPRRTKTTTPIRFDNTVAYEHYQLLFPTVRDPANDGYMQIAEVELLEDVFEATAPDPADGATGVMMPLLKWTSGDTVVLQSVYFGTTPDLTADNLVATNVSTVMNFYYHAVPLESGGTYYWRVDGKDAAGTVYTGQVWSFTTAPTSAFNPSPRDGEKWVSVDTQLSWEVGQGATSHKVYFSTDQAAVEARDASALATTIVPPVYAPTGLVEETTYCWAVDEIGAVTYPGDVWTFTTVGQGGGLKGEYFSNTTLTGTPVLTRIDEVIDFGWADGSPDASLPANGWSARWTADLEVAVSDTFTFSVTSEGGTRLWIDNELIIDQWVSWVETTYASLPMYLEKGIHSLQLEFADWDRNATQRLYWSTPYIDEQIIPAGPLQPPLRSRSLYPRPGDVNVPQDVTLTWGAGENATVHQLYFGDDDEAVANATTADTAIYRGEQALDATSYDLSGLEWNKTYYWRVDEVNDAEEDSPWIGNVWSFTTADFIVVDDFESYTNDVGSRIFQTWIDGIGYSEPAPGNPGNGSGALVGHDIWSSDSQYYNGQIAETSDVHGGAQAMPLYFDNSADPFYSEAERTWTTAQDWTVNGVTDLSLWLKGSPVGFLQTGPDSFTVSAAGADIYGGVDEFRFVYKPLSGDGSITVRVDSIDDVHEWTKAGVMIRSNLNALALQAHMVASPRNRVEWMYRNIASSTTTTSLETAVGSNPIPHWVRITRSGSTITGEHSDDGVNWTPITADDGTESTIELVMPGTVYIGVVMSSHEENVTATGEFSNVATTGSVSGQWQVTEPAGVHPANDLANVYVALEDSTNGAAVVSYPDGSTVTDWTQWKIPLADFVGVNPSAISKMYIGVGDRDVPVEDGSGMILIDDIRVVKPVEDPNEG